MKFSHYLPLMLATFAIGFADIASAQPGGQRGARRGDDMMSLLRNESVQTEIDLVDDQMQEIETMQEQMWAEIREEMAAARDLEPEERRARFMELREEMAEKRRDYDEKVESVLLPHQLKRLKELQVQSRARRYGNNGSIGILQDEEILEELGIDEDKAAELEEKAEEVMEKLQEKIRKLRTEAEDEILSVLSSEQQKKFREMVGESFEFQRDRRQATLQAGGGAGGKGGEGRRNRRGRPNRGGDSQP